MKLSFRERPVSKAPTGFRPPNVTSTQIVVPGNWFIGEGRGVNKQEVGGPGVQDPGDFRLTPSACPREANIPSTFPSGLVLVLLTNLRKS